MDRTNEIMSAAIPICMEYMEIGMERLANKIDDYIADYANSFVRAMNRVLTRTKKLQELGKKGKVQILYFSYLHSNILQDKFGYQIDVFDKDFFVDQEEVYEDWDVSGIFEYVEEDWEKIGRRIESKVPRMKAYELQEMKRSYAFGYYRFVEEILENLLPLIEKLKVYTELEKEENITICIGEYMGTYKCLQVINKKEEEE
ncbi:hypothetical protein [Anaeromicropila populeti]|uniref:Uncharacterized protein n=1 Tax=Anaeromicropila populeti TaxID=37658 RepID=A0A1I6KCQ6_9FIRM|nr:hypothetical protein [Anaeromicropila populeti]SFR89022.1 hypothetical protein SAMN05661086_02375 [Anaeromicropila populeti]